MYLLAAVRDLTYHTYGKYGEVLNPTVKRSGHGTFQLTVKPRQLVPSFLDPPNSELPGASSCRL